MNVAQEKENDRLMREGTSTPSATVLKNSLTRYGLIAAIAESILGGISLFSAFIIQRNLLNLGSNQFIIGRGELLKMSAGIAFCYAFVFVLRRGYLSAPGKFRESAKRIARYTAETYVIFLAMLFLIKDINFVSARLSIGLGFILCIIGLNVSNPVLNLLYRKHKKRLPKRSIVLKKPSAPAVSPAIPERSVNIRPGLIPVEGEPFRSLYRPSKVFVINSVEDIRRLELMTTDGISCARIGNLSLGNIPEAVKTARKRGLRLELVSAEDINNKRDSLIRS